LEIISGDQEADWAFQGVTTDPRLATIPLLLLDVGGGSTEFILGHGERKHFRQSFSLGTVRLLEALPHSDPPTAAEFSAARRAVREFIETNVHPALAPALQREIQTAPAPIMLVGTGGSATILARMEAELHTFDRAIIEKAGYPLITPVIVLNADDFGEVSPVLEGDIAVGGSLITVDPKPAAG